MKSFARARSFVAFMLAVCLLATPIVALAKKGEKNFNRGMEYEKAQQWEKAAQEFALAVAALPSDTEYQLHYQRALFNASQSFMQRGRSLAEQGDYVGAYNAFRQAYGYDPVNGLAASEMDRMLRLQREKQGLPIDGSGDAVRPGGDRRSTPNGVGSPNGGRTPNAANGTRASVPVQEITPRTEQLKVINYSGELEPLVRKLAEELSLNVVFDRDFAQQVGKRQVTYNLRDVTTARALDYIFAAQGLFFQKLDRRTILVADQSKRPQYQQLVLRTFYLFNIEPEAARQLIQQALPANAGRQPTVTLNKTTNSITVRDTPENIRLIAELLPTVDKDRSEVVMEVSIFEVSRTDLLQIGNQFGSGDTLLNFGGFQGGSVLYDGARRIATQGGTIPVAMGVGLLIPSSTLSALQQKDRTRLVFSTQVHAFDDEKSETRIGQKVPVQTASVTPFGFGTGTNTGTGTGTATPGVFSGGFPVIQYEDTGLSLDFTPKVFPNGDVQVKMVIDSKDAIFGANALTPTFTQRRITGLARIPNNRTIMVASIAQDRQSDGRQGLPLLGLIPVLGRLFTAPRRNNVQSDIVMTMTPRVLRAPAITPADEEMRNTGSIQTPQSDSLEALVRDADREDQLARARSLPTNTVVQLPPATEPLVPTAAAAQTQTPAPVANTTEQVAYVPAPNVLVNTSTPAPAANNNAATQVSNAAASATTTPAAATNATLTNVPTPTKNVALETATSGAATLKADAPVSPAANATAAPATVAAPLMSAAELRLVPEAKEQRVGSKQRVMLSLKTDAPLGLAAMTLRFDPALTKISSVSKGSMFDGKAGEPVITHSIDASKGVLVVSVAPAPGGQPLTGEGVLLVIEVEAIAPGEGSLGFDAGQVHAIATDGRSVLMQAVNAQLKLIQ
ncbi:MAG TPA: secretin N-terminal domain-containing protein [Pyrinomonadaceae bacterium]|jgi:general secretion pathway protein D